jgi:hypothetical protein
LLERLPGRFSPTFATDAYELFRRLKRGGTAGAEALAELGELLEQGATETQCWEEIVLLVGERRKLARVQQQHAEKMQHYLAIQHAIIMFTRMAEAVAHRVEDNRLRTLIADDFDRIAEGVLGHPNTFN